MPNVLNEVFTPRAIAEFWENNPSNLEPYLGEAWFPPMKKLGLDLKWIKGREGLPISLMPSRFDTEPTFRDREGFKLTQTKMPFFREGYHISEEDRQEIMRIQDSGDPYLAPILDRIFQDAARLIEGARVVAERERMQLLFPIDGDAGISIKANNVDYTYDYDAPEPGGSTRVWKSTNYFALTGTSLWTATSTADPFTDISTAQGAVNGLTGTTPTVAIMNSTTFHLLPKIDAVKNQRTYLGGVVTGFMPDAELTNVLQNTLGLTVRVYDKQYRDESGNVQKYVPDGYVCLLPNHSVGATYFGTTPEEADLMNGAVSGSQVSLIDTGIALHQKTESGPPVELYTYASEIVLPSYEGMNEVALLKVTA